MRDCVVFGDIHLGHKNNSDVFNKDCIEYLKWMINITKERNIKSCFFLGDWHHVRSSLNIKTLNYSLEGLRLLSENFDEVYMLLGNHDLYYRESLKFHSIEYAKEFNNIHVLEDVTTIDDCTLVPWLLESEYKKLKKINTKYIFGHFELPGFLLNSMVTMPDLGHFNVSDFSNKTEYILSGHFHKRQKRTHKNSEIHYIGNCFPHDFSDTNDTERGFVIIEDDSLEFIDWEECPNYLKTNLSDLLENGESLLTDKTYAKIALDLNLAADEINFIRETFMNMFSCRELSFTFEKDTNDEDYDVSEVEFESVDSIVLNCIERIESKNISKKMLIDIYNNLSEDIKKNA